MARILETLKRETGPRRAAEPPPPAGAAPEAAPALPADVPPEEANPEIPFIEVGGRGLVLEASSAVLAASASLAEKRFPLRKAAAVAAEPAPAPPAAPGAEAGPVALSFQPLNAPAQPAAAGDRFARELVAFHQPEDVLAEQYRSLAASLTGPLPAGEPRVLLFTSPAGGPAQTTVVLNLAITFARRQQGKVAVVDAGAGPGGLAQKLGLSAGPGLREVLLGKASLPGALRETGQPNLLTLTAGEAGQTCPPPAEALKGILRRLRKCFDLVLVDGRPWDGSPEIVTLGSACDMVYLIVSQAKARGKAVEELQQAIPRQGSRLGGCILTTP